MNIKCPTLKEYGELFKFIGGTQMISPRQKKILQKMKNIGSLSLAVACSFYSDRSHGKDVMGYLSESGYCKQEQGNFGYFVLTQKGEDYLSEQLPKKEEDKVYILLNNLTKRVSKLEDALEIDKAFKDLTTSGQ